MRWEDLILLSILLDDDDRKPRKSSLLGLIIGLTVNFILIILLTAFILAFFDKYINGPIFYSILGFHLLFSIIVIINHFKSK